jgi:hypothetical protein
MDQAIMFRVRERAYHIWAAKGGDAEKNWLQAETEILQVTAPSDAPVQAPKLKAKSRQRKASQRSQNQEIVRQ